MKKVGTKVVNLGLLYTHARLGWVVPNYIPEKGAFVVASIRPESLRLSPDASEGANTIDGYVSDLIYLGETVQYTLRATDGTDLQVSELNPAIVREPGQAWIHARADPEDVVVLPPPSPSPEDS